MCRINAINLFDFVTPEITNICNYSCVSCPHRNMQRPQGFMNMDLFVKIYKECQVSARELNLSFFGEPMLHPNFLDILAYMKANRGALILSLNTNLSCATYENLKGLIEVPFNQVRFSIDAATPMTYKRVRPAEFTLDLDGNRYHGNRLDLIDEKISWWHSLDNHIPTKHVYTVSSLNVDELPVYAEKWIPLFNQQDDLLAKRLLTYGGKISDPLIKSHPCNVWDMRMAAIDWQGNVSPCNLDTEMELRIGNIQNSSLEKIYNSKAWGEARRLCDKRNSSPCNNCVDSNAWASDRKLVMRAGDKWDDIFWKRFR